MPLDHDGIRSLLAAHALDAAGDAEGAEIEAHVLECDECRSELDDHRRVASLIGAQAAESEIPPDLWNRIESTIEPQAPVIQLPVRRTPIVALTGVAAALLLLVGVQTARLDTVQGRLTEADATLAAIGDAVSAGDWGAVADISGGAAGRTIALAGDAPAEVVLLDDGTGFITASDLPDPEAGETYQLWVVQRGEVVSADLLRPGVVGSAFRYDPDTLDAIVVTREVAAGVVVAEGPAVAVWSEA